MSSRYKFKTRLKTRCRPLRQHGRLLTVEPSDNYDRAGANVYSSERWKLFAMKYKQANPRCVKCGATNNESRLYVDHKIEIADMPYGELDTGVWDERNLQTLCARCHGKKTEKEKQKRKQKTLETELSWLDE